MSEKTCDGCVSHEDGIMCGHPNNWVDCPNVSGQPLRPLVTADHKACDLHTPDLECRKVIALEAIAGQLTVVPAGTKQPDDCACNGNTLDRNCIHYGTPYCGYCEYNPYV